MLFQGLFRPRRLYFVQMGVDIFQAVVLDDQVCGRLFTDGGNAGDVVGGVAHEGFHVDEFRRRHLVFPLYVLRVIVVDFRGSAARFGDADFDVGIRKLEQVAVAGDDGDLDSHGLRFFRRRAEDVVSLIALSR